MSIAADTLMVPAAPVRGPAFYFNGVTSKRHDVIVETAANSLRIIDDDQQYVVDEWNYADLRSRSAPEGILRLGRRGEAALARLEIRDAALAAAIEVRAPALDRGGAADRRLRQRVVVLSLAAIASLVLTAIFGMPVLANKITPLIPLPMERKFGEAIDKQVRPLLDTGNRGAAFQCGTAPGEAQGRKSLDKLVRLGDGRNRALPGASRGGAPETSECVRLAGRPRLRVRRAIGEERDAGRARRRHRP